MLNNSVEDSSSEGAIIAEPQTHYQKPWKRLNNALAYFMVIMCIIMLITLFLPDGPGTPFVVAYMIFTVVGGFALIFFALTNPGVGLLRKVHLRRISSDFDGDSAFVQVWTIRPFFGLKRCEQIGGREPSEFCEGGIINYNVGYTHYKSIFGMELVRCRWEPALFVLGSGEGMDCTDVVNSSDEVRVTRLQWLRRGDQNAVI